MSFKIILSDFLARTEHDWVLEALCLTTFLELQSKVDWRLMESAMSSV